MPRSFQIKEVTVILEYPVKEDEERLRDQERKLFSSLLSRFMLCNFIHPDERGVGYNIFKSHIKSFYKCSPLFLS